MSARTLPRLLAAVTAAVLLLTGWLLLPRTAHSQTLPLPSPAGSPTGVQGEGVGGEGLLPLVQRLERAASPSRPQGSLSLHLDLDTAQVAGRVPAPLPVVITLTRDSVAVQTLIVTPFADGGEYWYASGWEYPYFYYVPVPGDVLLVRQGAETISLTVPSLTARLSAPRDVLTGTAPAGASLSAWLFPFDDPAAWYTATSSAGASGAYTLTWAAFPDLRPRDRGYLRYALDADRSVYRGFIAPFLRVRAGGLQVDGLVMPRQDVNASEGGYWWGTFSDALGRFSMDSNHIYSYYGYPLRPPPLAPGDRFSLFVEGQIVSTTVQSLTAHAAATGVYGTAPPGAQVEVLRFAGPLEGEQSTWDGAPLQRLTVTVDASGAYSLPMSLHAGDYGYVLLDNPDGHQTFDWFVLPYARFRLGWHSSKYAAVSGQVDVSAPLTVSVRGSGDYLKTYYNLEVFDNGAFPDRDSSGRGYGWPGEGEPGVGFALESGDRVTLTQQGQGVLLVAGMPSLTLQMDEAGSALYGEAPAGARLTLSRYTDAYDYPPPPATSAVVTASLTGTYRLPLSVLGTAGHRNYFGARWESPAGYAVERLLHPERDTVSDCPSEGRVEVGGNTVSWYAYRAYCSGTMEIRLLDADGTLKAETSASAFSKMAQFTDAEKRPVPILGGDTLEFELGGEIVRWEVPPLSARLDSDSPQVTGSGVPGDPLAVRVYFPDSFWSAVVTPTASGAFTLPLPLTPTAGTRLQVWYAPFGGPKFLVRDALPAWEVNLSDSQVVGILPPLTPYTLTLRPAGTHTPSLLNAVYAGSEGDIGVSFLTPFVSGDVLTLTLPSGEDVLEIPTLNAWLDARTAEVRGQAPPGASLRIFLGEKNRHGWSYFVPEMQETTADSEGRYRVVFPELAGAESLSGWLYYRETAVGSIRLDFVPPHWEVSLGGSRVGGTAPSLGGRGAFRWEGVSGGVFTATLNPSALDGHFFAYLPEAVQAGDRLMFTDTQGTVLSFTVPQVRVEHDYARQVATGEAPPHDFVEIVFVDGYGSLDVSRNARTDASGHFGVDTSDLRLRPGGYAYLLVTDRQGNIVRLGFHITGYRTWFPVVVR